MTLPSLHGPVVPWILWNLGAFLVAWFPHSILEWISHRFVLHSPAIVRFAYNEHDRRHHVIYSYDSSFSRPDPGYGRDFNLRDWVLFLAFVMPAWAGLEVWIGKPILAGTFLAACAYLHAFNVVHRHFHAPSGGWLERRGFFLALRRHHQLHHARFDRNLNVVFPFADWLLRTRMR